MKKGLALLAVLYMLLITASGCGRYYYNRRYERERYEHRNRYHHRHDYDYDRDRHDRW